MSQLNFAQARFNMVEQQIRTWEVLDQQILDLMLTIPREEFVPAAYRNLAFADIQIPLAHGQVMMSPPLEGRLLQSLMIKPTDSVLEIGTGSGHLTALLARLAKHVVSIDIFEDFIHSAREKLTAQQITNVALQVGDAINGWKSGGYDVIVITGSLVHLPSAFRVQLNQEGRLFVILGTEPIMQATLVTRIAAQEWQTESLFETTIPQLIGNQTGSTHFIL